MTPVCSESISFLRLEGHALGALDARESAKLRAHVEVCQLCRARHERIVANGIVLRPLPHALPAAAPRPRSNVVSAGSLRWAGAALAVAAALWLVFLPRESLHAPQLPPARKAIKGGSLALTLVRERGGAIALDPGVYREGDRWKVLLTCPNRARVHWDVVVFQSDAAFFPLAPTTTIECANQLPLGDAFTLDGYAPVTICASIDAERPLDRTALRARGRAALPATSVCQVLPLGVE